MPIAHAIAEIARGFGQHVRTAYEFDWSDPSELTVVFSYRSEADFARLWGLDDSHCCGLTGIVDATAGRSHACALTMIIVWDGLSQDRDHIISVEPHITPFDWAIAFSSRLYASSVATANKPRVRILIVDLHSWRIGNAFARDQFYGLHNSIPWVQDYLVVPEAVSDSSMITAAVSDDPGSFPWLRQALPPDQRDEYVLVRDLKDPNRVLTTFADHDVPNRAELIESVHDIWRQQFVRAGDRHSVANLVGPLLLLSGLPGFQKRAREMLYRETRTRRALFEAVESTDYLHLANEADDPLPAVLANRSVGQTGSDVRFLLIDDMYQAGFQHVLAFLLFGGRYTTDRWKSCGTGEKLVFAGQGTLRCESAPDLLLEALRTERPHEWRLPGYLDLPDCDILILDLRLWTTMSDRQSRLARLIEVCQLLDIESLLSDQSSATQIGRAYAAARLLAQGDDRGSETEALALLPLLLSYLDPSLPIVLFSSTQQKRLAEMVGHRANIITKFSKPVLSGYGDQIQGTQLVSELQDAILSAIRLHNARPIWKRITSADWRWQPFMFDLVAPYTRQQPDRPAISGRELRAELASFYTRYVQRDNFYDFLPQPYMLLERAIVPDDETPQDDSTRTIYHSRARYEPDHGHNRTCLSLRQIRHHAAHGHASWSNTHNDGMRAAVSLMFSLLLDFIELRRYPQRRVKSELQSAVAKARNRLLATWPEAPRHPAALGKWQAVSSADFVVFAIGFYAVQAAEPNEAYLSEQTYQLLSELLDRLFLSPSEGSN